MKPKLIGVNASKLVILALHDIEVSSLNEEGVTLHDVAKFISEKYNIDFKKAKGDVHAVLVRGVTFGIFAEKNGRYKLEEVPEPPLNYPSSKSEKIKTILVETSNSNLKKKKPKRNDLGMDMTLEPWMDGKEESSYKDCRQMAKRRRALSEEENKFSGSDEDYKGLPLPYF